MRALPTPRLRYMEWLLKRLREAGFSPELTYHALSPLDSHILGFTLWQLGHAISAKELGDGGLADLVDGSCRNCRPPTIRISPSTPPALAGVEGDGEFEFGLDLILDGLKRARAAAAGAA